MYRYANAQQPLNQNLFENPFNLFQEIHPVRIFESNILPFLPVILDSEWCLRQALLMSHLQVFNLTETTLERKSAFGHRNKANINMDSTTSTLLTACF